MAVPVGGIHTTGVDLSQIIPGFDPTLGVEPSDPLLLLACKRQGILPKELLLKEFEFFRGIRGETPVHIAKNKIQAPQGHA